MLKVAKLCGSLVYSLIVNESIFLLSFRERQDPRAINPCLRSVYIDDEETLPCWKLGES